ncbi:uncharacterized protein Fot_27079 [Forsythia ovata]|uniref:Calmodulin-binding domain-containing protein n=1 Tax=Forsythia ovata TaxID=205694 RepID=A0ABD1UDP3_9LAMI
MAEGSISSMVTLEENELDGRNMGKISSGKSGSPPNNGGNVYSQHCRASIGAYDARDSTRRNSTEKLESANISQKLIPHYLRASTGSCHDFCKYGRKHAFEVKERRSIPKRIARPPSNEQNSVEKTVPAEQKKKIVAKHKASSGTKSLLPEHKPSPDAKSFSPKPKLSLDTQIYSSRQKASPGNKTHMRKHKPSSSKETPSPYAPEIIKREIVLPSKNVEVPPKQDSSIDNKMPWSDEKTKNVSNKHSPSMQSKTVTVRLSSSPNTSDGIHGKGRRNSVVKTSGKMMASKASVKKAFAPLPASVSPKISLGRTMLKSSSKETPSPYAPEIIKREIVLPSKNVEVPPKQDSSIDNKMPWSDEKTKNVSNKHSPSLQSKTVTLRLSSSPNTSDGIHGKGRGNSFVKTSGKMMASKASVKKAFALLPASVSPKISLGRTMSLKARKVVSLKVMSPLKDRIRIRKAETKRSGNEKIPEKTLDVIRTDGHVVQSRPSPSSLKSLSHAKLPSLLCHEEEEEETEYDESEVYEMISAAAEVGKVKLVKEKHIRKSRAGGSEDRDGTPVKLKFRRGKVVDLKSDNNNPRRLRFRRGRILVEDQEGKGDLRRKTFKNGVVNDDKNDADSSSEKVVLKHQNIQGKKDAQGLFNNVIEETASKLVKSRKSKVKALVGAFETVISLQESKSPSHDAT